MPFDLLVAVREWLKTQPKLRNFTVCNCSFESNKEIGLQHRTVSDLVHMCNIYTDGVVRAGTQKVKLNIADPEFFNKLHKLLWHLLVTGRLYEIS